MKVTTKTVQDRITILQNLRTISINEEFQLECLLRLLPVMTAQPVKLPASFSPDLSVIGADARCVMRADKKGRWLNRAAVELSIRAAGYEVQE